MRVVVDVLNIAHAYFGPRFKPKELPIFLRQLDRELSDRGIPSSNVHYVLRNSPSIDIRGVKSLDLTNLHIVHPSRKSESDRSSDDIVVVVLASQLRARIISHDKYRDISSNIDKVAPFLVESYIASKYIKQLFIPSLLKGAKLRTKYFQV